MIFNKKIIFALCLIPVFGGFNIAHAERGGEYRGGENRGGEYHGGEYHGGYAHPGYAYPGADRAVENRAVENRAVNEAVGGAAAGSYYVPAPQPQTNINIYTPQVAPPQ